MSLRIQELWGELPSVKDKSGRRQERIERDIVYKLDLSKSWPTQWEVLEQRLPIGGVPHWVQMTSH